MSADEFLGLTMRQAAAMYQEWKAEQARECWRIAPLTVLFANANRDRELRPAPFTVEELFPILALDKATEDERSIHDMSDPEAIKAAFLRKLAAAGHTVQSARDQQALLSIAKGYIQ